MFHILADTFVSFYLVGYSFRTYHLGFIVSRMRQYISSHGGFRFVMQSYFFGRSGRSHVPDVLANSYLDTTYILSAGYNLYHLIVERSGKGRGVNIHVVHFLFVSHLIDRLVLM